MVLNLKIERHCERCGAKKSEAPLTISHSPHQKILRICSFPQKEREKLAKTYVLCERCRRIHYELERKIIVRACQDLAKLHERYLNQ